MVPKRRLVNYLFTCISLVILITIAGLVFLLARLAATASTLYCQQFCDCSAILISQVKQLESKPVIKNDFPTLNNVIIKYNKKTVDQSSRCASVTGRRILINYANVMYHESQKKSCDAALDRGFDVCIQFNKTSIDNFFEQVNHDILSRFILAGYAAWKPFIIYKTLLAINENDVLFYTDSGSMFVASPERHVCLMNERNQDVVVFSAGLQEKRYSKPAALWVLNCLTKDCTNSMQRMSGIVIVRKSLRSLVFIASWLTYNQDERIVGEGLEQVFARTVDQIPGYFDSSNDVLKANRHDQTVLSILSKRYKIPEWPDPSQFGESGWNAKLRQLQEFKNIRNHTIIVFTRNKN